MIIRESFPLSRILPALLLAAASLASTPVLAQDLGIQVGAQAPAHGCLGAQQRLEGAMSQRVPGHERHSCQP